MLRKIFVFLALVTLATPGVAKETGDYQQYLDFFQEVYKTFQDNYYLPPDQGIYEHFLGRFKTQIYPKLKGEGKSNDYVRWRSAWYLANALRSKDDRFTQFYPPKPAKEFKQEALGEKVDLGIEGKKTRGGFLVTRMEPRSDAYDKGLRAQDLVLRINNRDTRQMTQEDIEADLTPLVGTKIKLLYLNHETRRRKTIEPVSKEYFKQTVFLHPVPVDGVFCLEIPKFNRMTGEDLFRYLRWIEPQHPKGLVLDLRDNPGGPPLAARAISAFFLEGGQEFAYFQRRNAPKADLDVPQMAPQYQFHGPIVILVNADSGSATELFAGIMQFRGRAVVLGTNTAGQVLLKTMFPMDDGSMLALVVARGHYPDGTPFSFEGITPDQIITNAPKDGLIDLAAAYIASKTKQPL